MQVKTERPSLRSYLTGGDVAATDQSRQLWRLGRQKNGLRSHQGDFLETNSPAVSGSCGPISLAWRLGGDSSLRWLRRRLLETSRVSWESREIQTCSIFFFFLRLFPVSSRSRRRDTSPIPAGDWKMSPKKKLNMFQFPATPRRPG